MMNELIGVSQIVGDHLSFGNRRDGHACIDILSDTLVCYAQLAATLPVAAVRALSFSKAVREVANVSRLLLS